MTHDSTHNLSIIELVNGGLSNLDPREHLFVVRNEKLYEMCGNYNNVVLERSIVDRQMDHFKEYASRCEYLFLHNHSLTLSGLFRLEKSVLNKIVWSVWGHDLYNHRWRSGSKASFVHRVKLLTRNLLVQAYDKVWSFRTKQFYGIGVGFPYDALEIRRKFGKKVRIFSTPYGYIEGNISTLQSEMYKSTQNRKHPYKVMIGHSSHSFLNHVSILDHLRKFSNNNILISLVLAYGDEDYAQRVEDHAKKLFGKKVEIIDKPMPYASYIQYLHSVDASVLDFKHQTALGNIYLLLYMGKKLFLNKDGIIKTGCILEGIETYNVSDITSMNFDQFCQAPVNTAPGVRFATQLLDHESLIRMWEATCRELS